MINRLMSFTVIILLFALTTAGLPIAYPGVGTMTSGDFWETFATTGLHKYYGESWTDVTRNFGLIRFGNLERQWTTPTTMYPSGDMLHFPWGSHIIMTEYSRDAINNYTTDDDPRAPHYVNAFYMRELGGSPQHNADERGAAPWVDDARTQMMYTAEFPTNIGVDVRVRTRGFTVNEANMNDWIAIELELTNTGVQDVNCDGTPERQGHKIEALALNFNAEVIGSIMNTVRGTRRGASWNVSRMSGYDGTPDPDGNPWATGPLSFGSNIDPSIVGADGWVADGMRRVGYRHGRAVMRDLWNGFQFIAVKEGGWNGGSAATDKKTIYDTHPIGEGVQRGWYATSGRTLGGAPYSYFLAATGTFYENGGRTWDAVALENVEPDPNHFDTTQPYTAGDPLSFVDIVKPEADRGRPNGDMKWRGTWYQNWERNFPGTPAPGIPAEDTWTEGGTPPSYHNFDGNKLCGIGPFALEVDETITVVAVTYAGVRLSGARQSLKAARWAYENNWDVPKPPHMPDMVVKSIQLENGEFKAKVIWDDAADAECDGYKIYRVTAFPKINYDILGYRALATYHHQWEEHIGATQQQLADAIAAPINPNWSVASDYQLDWDTNTWGPWMLQEVITKAELANYANTDADAGDYPYAWIDEAEEVQFGRTYWYYVSAYKMQTGEMAGVSYTHLESHKDNWNGRDGRWFGTYHFATAANEFPTVSLADKKFIGAPFVLKPARVPNSDLISGAKEIEVKPNPYVVQAPHDVGLEHKIQFYNLTIDTRITIFDVSGQLVDVIEYEGTDPTDGSVFWDMFTKDGPEVASGLYIWLAEYPGGQQQGYLAIQR